MGKTAIEQRAARGAAFMDRIRPGWEQNVHLSILNIGGSERCVLGQCYGDYMIGTIALGISMRRQYRYGFIATKAGGCAEYPELTEAWANEVIMRLRTAMPAKPIAKPERSAAWRMQPSLS